MKRILTVLMAGALSFGMLTAAGCVDDPAAATCDDFDYYLANCYVACSTGWDCEYWYDSVDYDTQLDLDDCSICLADEADYGTCYDCTAPGGGSCQYLLESVLGITCAW